MAVSVFDIKGQKLLRMEKTEGELLPRSKYNAIIGLVIAAGLALNATMSFVLPAAILALMFKSSIAVFVGFIVLAVGSTYCIYKFDDPKISFIGFLVLSVAFGFVVTIAVGLTTGETAMKAFFLTAIITLVVAGLSFARPQVFGKMGHALFAILIVALVVEIIFVFVTSSRPAIFDLVFAGIFALYIGYDWQKAQAYPPTLDNAIDSAADIYVDIIGLFIHLLSLLGRGR